MFVRRVVELLILAVYLCTYGDREAVLFIQRRAADFLRDGTGEAAGGWRGHR